MRAVVAVIGKDTVGILAKVSNICAECNANVMDVTQTIMQDLFAMTMLIDITKCSVDYNVLADKLKEAGNDMFVTGEIRYHDYFEFEPRILLAEIGHYESEQYTKEIFCEIIQKKFPTFAIHSTQVDTNPINYL